MREAGARQIEGQLIELDEVLFTVVGVLESRQESYAVPVQVDADRSVFVPITTSQRLGSRPEIDVIIARSGAGVHYEAPAPFAIDKLMFLRYNSSSLHTIL